MSRRDPGAADGGPVREPGWCRCGHIEPVHRIRADHSRGACSTSTCTCRQYEPGGPA